MTKPDLKIVRQPTPAAAPPYDEQKGVRRVQMLKAQLLAACVRYVAEGSSGTAMDRLRHASDMSGIPRNLIEVEAAKKPR